MKTWSRYKAILIAVIAFYAFFSFFNFNLNPAEWGSGSRFWFAFLSLLVWLNEEYG